MNKGIVNIYKFKDNAKSPIPAYMMVSTASVNIETDSSEYLSTFEKQSPDLTKMDLSSAVEEIAAGIDFKNPDIDLVIAIHGYNTNIINVKNWFKDIAAFANKDPIVNTRKNQIFLGYRWPSESFGSDSKIGLWKRFVEVFTALPIAPMYLLTSLFILYVITITSLIVFNNLNRVGTGILLALGTVFVFLFALFMTLIILRLTLYFRDSYRANNYAVPDLVEIIRQLDKALMMKSPGETWEQKQQFWDTRKVKLSFIGHSMGGFVVTNVVRIISDVFDPRSIGNLTLVSNDKEPDNNIGNTFSLGRLILVSPDIPIDSILEGRANFLSSSLRRFQETYLFCNEGDLALRLASSTANYFSYPARTRDSGYRLGNVAVTAKDFGIVNLDVMKSASDNVDGMSAKKALEDVTIGYGARGTHSILESRVATDKEIKLKSIAELFTFIDCTDYYDTTTYPNKQGKEIGVVSYSVKKKYLGFFNYLQLLIGYFFLGKDVHGGYFRGDYATELMYRLTFVGFRDYLSSVTPNKTKLVDGLQIVSEQMKSKRIQTILSPERYAQIAKQDWDRIGLI